MFASVLRNLKSPQNVGMIVRTHVAMGGREVIMLGHELPWRFRKGTQAFSRKLETMCPILHFRADDEFFDWAAREGRRSIAVEIDEGAALSTVFSWDGFPALVFGNEASGLPREFLQRCDGVVQLQQYGRVGSLNVAVSHAMITYELRRGEFGSEAVRGKYLE